MEHLNCLNFPYNLCSADLIKYLQQTEVWMNELGIIFLVLIKIEK